MKAIPAIKITFVLKLFKLLPLLRKKFLERRLDTSLHFVSSQFWDFQWTSKNFWFPSRSIIMIIAPASNPILTKQRKKPQRKQHHPHLKYFWYNMWPKTNMPNSAYRELLSVKLYLILFGLYFHQKLDK